MEINDIINIIKTHPELNLEQMIQQGENSGIPKKMIINAWQMSKKQDRTEISQFFQRLKSRNQDTSALKPQNLFKIILIYGLIGFEISTLYVIFLNRGNPSHLPLIIKLIDETSFFAIGALIFHACTKILGLQSSIQKSTAISALFYIINLIAKFMKGPAAFYPAGIFLVLTFYILMKAYDISALKTLGFILLEILFGIVLTFVVYWLINIQIMILK